MTAATFDSKVVNKIQADKLALVTEKFIRQTSSCVFNTPEQVQRLHELTKAVNYCMSAGILQDVSTNNKFRKLQDELKQVSSKPLETNASDKHHLSFAKGVYIEKIERIKEVKAMKKESALPTMSDTASAEKIQSLLQDQKDMYTKELEQEKKVQGELLEELSELTSVLKNTTLDIHSTVKTQNEQLTVMQEFAKENEDELAQQKKKMKDRTSNMSGSLWSSLGTMIWIVALFVLTYIVIRLLPRPANEVCPS